MPPWRTAQRRRDGRQVFMEGGLREGGRLRVAPRFRCCKPCWLLCSPAAGRHATCPTFHISIHPLPTSILLALTAILPLSRSSMFSGLRSQCTILSLGGEGRQAV